MPKPARRVVTGHDENGRSIIQSDGPAPNVFNRGRGVDFHEMWSVDSVPVSVRATEPEPTDRPLVVGPPPGGVKFRVNDIHPGHMELVPPRDDGVHRLMHRTQSHDFGILIEGELYLIVDDGVEVLLKPGDIVVQRGADHAWENRSKDKIARMAFILIDGKFSDDLRAKLPEELHLRAEPLSGPGQKLG